MLKVWLGSRFCHIYLHHPVQKPHDPAKLASMQQIIAKWYCAIIVIVTFTGFFTVTIIVTIRVLICETTALKVSTKWEKKTHREYTTLKEYVFVSNKSVSCN